MIPFTPECEINPNKVYIPAWGIKLYHYNADQCTISSTENETFASWDLTIKHPTLNVLKRIKNPFEIRIWTDSKIITWWSNPKVSPFERLQKVYADLKSSNYVSCRYDARPIDLNYYTLIFREIIGGVPYIVQCKLQELTGHNEYNNSFERSFHCMPPINKRFLMKTSKIYRKWRHLYYREDCKVWSQRTKLDVAEWHLLMYEG